MPLAPERRRAPGLDAHELLDVHVQRLDDDVRAGHVPGAELREQDEPDRIVLPGLRR